MTQGKRRYEDTLMTYGRVRVTDTDNGYTWKIFDLQTGMLIATCGNNRFGQAQECLREAQYVVFAIACGGVAKAFKDPDPNWVEPEPFL